VWTINDPGYVGGVPRGVHNKLTGNEELILFILNCILLHNQNDGWTVPNCYFEPSKDI